MLKTRLIIFSLFLLFTFIFPNKAEAVFSEKERSAGIQILADFEREKTIKEQIETLTLFLGKYNSPLAPYAKVFVEEAYKNEIDWRLVASISGVESTFGRAIPVNSYNAYGWNNGNYSFQSWEDGISVVSRTLNEKYSQKWGAQTPYEIGRYYAASPTWAQRVSYFKDKIEEFTPKPVDLSLTL